MKRRILDALDLVLSLLLLVVLSPLWPFAFVEWYTEQRNKKRKKQFWEQRPTFSRTRDMRFRK